MSRTVFRPLREWTDPTTTDRKGSQFKTSYDATLRQLRQEADLLDAPEAVIQVVTVNGEADLRIDGMLRASAKIMHPGVVISMDTKHGPLRLATDAFTSSWRGESPWVANLRAITLGLESLRRLDRYGITRSGQQYTGWKALPPGGIALGGTPAMSKGDAAVELYAMAYPDRIPELNRTLIDDPKVRATAYGRAARRLHPDMDGGSTAAFQRLQEINRVLEAAS